MRRRVFYAAFLTTLVVYSLLLLFSEFSLQQMQQKIFLINQTDHSKKIALFIQAQAINDPVIFNDIFQCVENVGKAKKLAQNFELYRWVNVKPPETFEFDIFINYPVQTKLSLIAKFKELGARQVYGTPIFTNEGMDIKQFLSQLQLANNNLISYDYFLKVHSKSDGEIRRVVYESLCGSPAIVFSALRALHNRDIGMVAPFGLVYKNRKERPILAKKAQIKYGKIIVFTDRHIERMKSVYRQMTEEELGDDVENYVCIIASMFWSRYNDFRVEDYVRIIPWLSNQWINGREEDFGVEHAMERLFGTIPILNNLSVAEIGPAVKPIGVYLPQLYPVRKNDNNHGKEFTKQSKVVSSTKSLPAFAGGLGIYDLNEVEIRRKQGELAKAAGLYGFMYSHYWIAGKDQHIYSDPVMGKFAELMLSDGHPDIPFVLSWVNEPRSNDGVEMPHQYGTENDWKTHFFYLIPFFKHKNYITVDEKPAFIIDRIGHMEEVLEPMLTLWRHLAEENGLKGLHIIAALHQYIPGVVQEKIGIHYDASFQFFSTIEEVQRTRSASSTHDSLISGENNSGDNISGENIVNYWGAVSSFEAQNNAAKLVSPTKFRQSLEFSLNHMVDDIARNNFQINIPNLLFIFVWNNWNEHEQATSEPNDTLGFSYLSAVKEYLENQPIVKVL